MTRTSPSSTSGNTFAGLSLAGPLGVSLIAILVAAVLFFAGMASVVASALGRGAGSVHPEEQLGQWVAKHDESVEMWKGRIDGRSPFFKPPAPYVAPQPVLPRPTVVDPPPVVDTTPKIDPVYRGPNIAFAYGDTVYFQPLSANDNPKYLRINVGEEKSGLKVIETKLPWSVKVGYKGGEYDVPIFARTENTSFLLTTPKPVILSNFIITAPTPEGAEVNPTLTVQPAGDAAAAAAQQETGAQQNPRGPSSRARAAAPRAVPRERPQPESPNAGGEQLPNEVDVVPDQAPGDDDVDDEGDDGDEEDPEADAAESQEQPATPDPAPAQPGEGGETPKAEYR